MKKSIIAKSLFYPAINAILFLTNQKMVSPVLSPHKMDKTTKMLWQ